jgi:hypothetical protein
MTIPEFRLVHAYARASELAMRLYDTSRYAHHRDRADRLRNLLPARFDRWLSRAPK